MWKNHLKQALNVLCFSFLCNFLPGFIITFSLQIQESTNPFFKKLLHPQLSKVSFWMFAWYHFSLQCQCYTCYVEIKKYTYKLQVTY